MSFLSRMSTRRSSAVLHVLVLSAALALHSAGAADGAGMEQFWKINTKPEVFLTEVFGPSVPAPQVAPSTSAPGTLQPPPQRVRYWRANGRTVWIFDEIGKAGYQPTTCAFVVKNGAIEIARVLVYRESRGEQVGEASFLAQLAGAKAAGGGLDRNVDNISGATYSVKMMQRMAVTALMLDAQIASASAGVSP
jgi:hypothetical protein